jgi:hypothetical protein
MSLHLDIDLTQIQPCIEMDCLTQSSSVLLLSTTVQTFMNTSSALSTDVSRYRLDDALKRDLLSIRKHTQAVDIHSYSSTEVDNKLLTFTIRLFRKSRETNHSSVTMVFDWVCIAANDNFTKIISVMGFVHSMPWKYQHSRDHPVGYYRNQLSQILWIRWSEWIWRWYH